MISKALILLLVITTHMEKGFTQEIDISTKTEKLVRNLCSRFYSDRETAISSLSVKENSPISSLDTAEVLIEVTSEGTPSR